MSNIGPDFFRQTFPQWVVERMAVMSGTALGMVLAVVEHQAQALAARAELIATYDDDPVRVKSEWVWPGTRFSAATKEAADLIGQLLDAAKVGEDEFTNAQLAAAVRDLVAELVPVDQREDVLAAAERIIPADGSLGRWELRPDEATLGDLYVAVLAAGWLASQPRISPVRHGIRRHLLQRIHDFQATERGIPQDERIDVTDAHAVALLDSIFVRDADRSAFGGIGMVHPDPRQRSLLELEVAEAARAHLIEHPLRSPATDRALRNTVAAILGQPSPAPAVAMTPTEQQRADKLAARKARRGNKPKGGGRR